MENKYTIATLLLAVVNIDLELSHTIFNYFYLLSIFSYNNKYILSEKKKNWEFRKGPISNFYQNRFFYIFSFTHID